MTSWAHTNQSWMANLYKQCKNENSRNIYTLLNHTVLDLFYTLKDTEPKVATYKVRQTPLLPIHHESPFNFFWPYIKVFALAIQLNFNNFKLIHSSVCILPQDALHQLDINTYHHQHECEVNISSTNNLHAFLFKMLVSYNSQFTNMHKNNKKEQFMKDEISISIQDS